MKASEFVAQVQALIAEHGDLPIVLESPEEDRTLWMDIKCSPGAVFGEKPNPRWLSVWAE